MVLWCGFACHWANTSRNKDKRKAINIYKNSFKKEVHCGGEDTACALDCSGVFVAANSALMA